MNHFNQCHLILKPIADLQTITQLLSVFLKLHILKILFLVNLVSRVYCLPRYSFVVFPSTIVNLVSLVYS